MFATNTVTQHISKVELSMQDLADLGEPVRNIDKVAKILSGLLAKYSPFITA